MVTLTLGSTRFHFEYSFVCPFQFNRNINIWLFLSTHIFYFFVFLGYILYYVCRSIFATHTHSLTLFGNVLWQPLLIINQRSIYCADLSKWTLIMFKMNIMHAYEKERMISQLIVIFSRWSGTVFPQIRDFYQHRRDKIIMCWKIESTDVSQILVKHIKSIDWSDTFYCSVETKTTETRSNKSK